MAYVFVASYWRHRCPDCYTEVVGRLDHLVEAVYERFKDRYFQGESESRNIRHLLRGLTESLEVVVDLTGRKYVSFPCRGRHSFSSIA